MSYNLTFSIQGLPHTTNSLGRKHWTIKAREARNWRQAVVIAVGTKNRPANPLPRAHLTLTRYSSGSCDSDGLVSSFKAIIDGLVDAQVIENDKFVNIGMPVYLHAKCKPGGGYVMIQVRALD